MAKKETPTTSNEEQIGFHKGSLSTLAKEREELARILQIVEQLMQMHIQGLKELGVDLEAAAKKASKKPKAAKAKPIEDMLR
jgi:biotin operon repressor|tara:strand:- start:1046 stop:1291 length:246 start_codon:yes stop_codon:yes gene_type:complete